MSLKYGIFLIKLSVFMKETTVITVRVKNMTFKLPLELKRKKTQMVYEILNFSLSGMPLCFNVESKIPNYFLHPLGTYIFIHWRLQNCCSRTELFHLHEQQHLLLNLDYCQKGLHHDTEKLLINIEWTGLTKICLRSSEPHAVQLQSRMQGTHFQLSDDMMSWINK